MTCDLCNGTRFVYVDGNPGEFTRKVARCPKCTVRRRARKRASKQATKRRPAWKRWQRTLDELGGPVAAAA